MRGRRLNGNKFDCWLGYCVPVSPDTQLCCMENEPLAAPKGTGPLIAFCNVVVIAPGIVVPFGPGYSPVNDAPAAKLPTTWRVPSASAGCGVSAVMLGAGGTRFTMLVP